jgi:Fe-S oxidoreductase
MPKLPSKTLSKWANQYLKKNNIDINEARGELILFIDEFSNYQDAHIGKDVVKLLTYLKFHIHIVKHEESGRTYLSKGLVKKAQQIARKNINIFSVLVKDECPLVGIEPSSILCFRDEYMDLCGNALVSKAKEISKNTFLFEEFIIREFDKGNISETDFNDKEIKIKMHGHCHQKALSDTSFLKRALEIPKNIKVTEIKSGCCGMAGSFGYEKEHYDVSMKIGELVLFPEIRKAQKNELIVAPGTSCREQIKDGTNKLAFHPAQILLMAINKF